MLTVTAELLACCFKKVVGFELLAILLALPIATLAAEPALIRIPAGAFAMGAPDAAPRNVIVNEFLISPVEVTQGVWADFRAKALARGYTTISPGQSVTPTSDAALPVVDISGYDRLAWCNARSEEEGLVPCYYTYDAAQSNGRGVVYRNQGAVPLVCDFTATGYRVPTGAEWEKAARGGLSNATYPWGNDPVTAARANWVWADGYPKQLTAAGTYAANAYGLYDMAGNVWELTWEAMDDALPTAGSVNPRNEGIFVPTTTIVVRGGGWNSGNPPRCSYRGGGLNLLHAGVSYGFRLVRNSSAAPVITAQPETTTVAVGNSVTFRVTATGSQPITFQWTRNDVAISAATASSYTIANTKSTDAGTFRVIVASSAGTVTSAPAVLEVSAAAIPVITAQPSTQVVPAGQNVNFSVTASGTAPLSYQWRKGGADITGATSSTYSLRNVQSSDAASYNVVVSNGVGSVTSAAAALSVTSTNAPPIIAAQPINQIAGAGLGTNVIFTVGVNGTPPFAFQWRKNGVPLAGATNANLVIAGVTGANSGTYTVLASNAAGSATSAAATLTVIEIPTIEVQPLDRSVALGGSLVFSVAASGTGPLRYEWRKDGRPIAGTNSETLVLNAVTDEDAGSYSVTVTNIVSSVTSRNVTLEVSPAFSKIVNLAVRSGAGTANSALIVGFVVSGVGAPKPVLVRGIGPSLTQFGVSGAMSDPQLTLYRDGIFLQTNDDWGSSPNADQIASTIAATGAFSLDRRSKDSALRITLQPGAYTANISSNVGSGIALLELYDADTPLPTRLINVAARSVVSQGAGVLIVGFTIQGNAPKSVLVRGVGPALAAFGVSGALADPQLVLFKDGSEIVATNDDWSRTGSPETLSSVFAAVGAFALTLQSRDAALVTRLAPGSYTAQLSGANSGTGVALVEIYEVP